MTNQERTKVWEEAAAWGHRKAFMELYYQTDKPSVLMTLFRKTAIKAGKCKSKIEAARWEAYSEGFRHAINIMDSLGGALESYKAIINPSIKINLTEEDVKLHGHD